MQRRLLLAFCALSSSRMGEMAEGGRCSGEMNIIIRDVKRDIGISLSELGFEAGQIHLSGRAARIIRQQTNRQFS